MTKPIPKRAKEMAEAKKKPAQIYIKNTPCKCDLMYCECDVKKMIQSERQKCIAELEKIGLTLSSAINATNIRAQRHDLKERWLHNQDIIKALKTLPL